MSRHEIDVVVVGGGPSGLAAASWLGRYRRSVVVLDSREYRSGMVDRSHGYLGISTDVHSLWTTMWTYGVCDACRRR